MKFRKISSQKFDPTGEFFHDSAIQMQAFIAFAAQKFGINENTSYLCNVKGEAKQSHDVRNGGMAVETQR